MNDSFLIKSNCTVREAMALLGETQGLGLIVVNDSQKLLGTITDGDVRRSLLNGGSVDDFVEEVMCEEPLVSIQGNSVQDSYEEAREKLLRIIPVIDQEKTVVDILFVDDHKNVADIPVVIMAGGLGSRLGSLTEDCPKPMLEVGGRPILEIIIDRLKQQGFSTFYISVNYMAEVIEHYFGNGKGFDCNIQYIRESKKLGTAGALSLLPSELPESLFVMNGDLLTKVDFRNLREFHYSHKSPLTLGVRRFEHQVPYGVLSISGEYLGSLKEKPVESYFVNAGVYLLNTSLLKYIPHDDYFDMPALINTLIQQNIKVSCFPIVEKWIDIGQISHLNSARENYE